MCRVRKSLINSHQEDTVNDNEDNGDNEDKVKVFVTYSEEAEAVKQRGFKNWVVNSVHVEVSDKR